MPIAASNRKNLTILRMFGVNIESPFLPIFSLHQSRTSFTKGSLKNKFAELALRFGSDLVVAIE